MYHIMYHIISDHSIYHNHLLQRFILFKYNIIVALKQKKLPEVEEYKNNSYMSPKTHYTHNKRNDTI